MPTVGYVTHSACLLHDPGEACPERPARLRALAERFEKAGLLAELEAHEPREAERERVLAVHAPELLQRIEAACERAPAIVDDWDTNVSGDSLRAALLAAGGALEAAERIADGRWGAAFVAMRPPGHHAEHDRAMGFCYLNHVALTAQALRAVHGLERVAILDWDVHHGNGTQHLFERDPTVLYASLHQHPLYPGTGAREERGLGDGEGATINCPMPPGSGDADWLGTLEREVLPAINAFRPEALLVSSGFDAHHRDPLGSCELSEDGYAEMTRMVLDLAHRHAAGRVLSLLEGGYDLEGLAASAQAHVEALLAQ